MKYQILIRDEIKGYKRFQKYYEKNKNPFIIFIVSEDIKGKQIARLRKKDFVYKIVHIDYCLDGCKGKKDYKILKSAILDKVQGWKLKSFQIAHIYSFGDARIVVKTILHEYFGLPSIDYQFFIDKRSQRDQLVDKYSAKSFSVNNLLAKDSLEMMKKMDYPIIFKPMGYGVSGSVDVMKIENYENICEYIKNHENQILDGQYMVEEYVEGELYSIDFFVDRDGNIDFLILVKCQTYSKVFGVDDWALFSREVIDWKNKVGQNFKQKVKKMCQTIIKNQDIRDIFIHLEFRYDDEPKIIEINGRQGGARSGMMNILHNIDFLEVPLDEDEYSESNKKLMDMRFFPFKEYTQNQWEYDKQIVKTMKGLDTIYKFNLEKDNSQSIAPASKGGKKLGYIYLLGDNKQVQKDYQKVVELNQQLIIEK